MNVMLKILRGDSCNILAKIKFDITSVFFHCLNEYYFLDELSNYLSSVYCHFLLCMSSKLFHVIICLSYS